MADSLTIGGSPIRVVSGTWVEKPSLYAGGRVRARANNLISTEDDTTRKRVADCAVDLPTDADETALRAACPKGVGVAIAGDLPVTGFTAVVDIVDVGALRSEVNGVQVLLRAATIHLEET